TSYAPIRRADGTIIGCLVIGTAFNDERLTNASERTSGRILIAGVKDGDKLDIVAKSSGATPDLLAAVVASPAKDAAFKALTAGQVTDLTGLPGEFTASSVSLEGYGDGHRAVLISVNRAQGSSVVAALVWPALGVTLLGIVLVVIGAFMLDAYISRPIS